MTFLFFPPVAFMIYLGLAWGIFRLGKFLAGAANPSKSKSSIYGSGEKASSRMAAPGYTPFFLIAFFFTVLHLGVLVVGTGQLKLITAVYIVGLILCLLAFGADRDMAGDND
jgi:NADH:ubiquinone oxidoreductase subunit 3 (subunit A)